MKPMYKKLMRGVVILLIFLGLALLIDQGICNKWVYHDYAAGMDRKLSCFWKS